MTARQRVAWPSWPCVPRASRPCRQGQDAPATHGRDAHATFIAALVVLAALSGCGPTQSEYDACRAKLSDVRDEARNAKADLEAARQEVRTRDEQIKTLQGLGGEKRLDTLFQVRRIEVGPYTAGLGDKDGSGDTGVKVYVIPYDQQGSPLKAAGQITIQLYDLAAPEGHNLIAKCVLSPEEAGKNWYAAMLSYYFAIVCPLEHKPEHDQITVRVEFVDYLTGKTYSDQKVIRIALPGKPATAKAD